MTTKKRYRIYSFFSDEDEAAVADEDEEAAERLDSDDRRLLLGEPVEVLDDDEEI